MAQSAIEGERHLFERLYTDHHALLVRFLTRMTRCPQRAEDLAQVAWLKLLGARSRGTCRCADTAEIRAYLFKVARNAFLDEYTRKHEAVRTRCVDPGLLEDFASPAAGDCEPDRLAERQQVCAIVQEAVERLPSEQRRVIRMWSSGASIREMSTACRAPRDTVLSRKKYAVARLRGFFADGALAPG